MGNLGIWSNYYRYFRYHNKFKIFMFQSGKVFWYQYWKGNWKTKEKIWWNIFWQKTKIIIFSLVLMFVIKDLLPVKKTSKTFLFGVNCGNTSTLVYRLIHILGSLSSFFIKLYLIKYECFIKCLIIYNSMICIGLDINNDLW